ncbi:linear amide C-N hydrolase [Lutispora saccharofermentans]|uniref:Linear amide C-N hydrolase n=1 Tax=Lutispora saccharofermentans TaxID=3024236 RepID=A0ABT1NFJ7_9FIRM|nr:C45 family peptidase [Lutispora saccharofermentans]MCQ1530015.1 linear amide C-N hydrolase [Lutispora saccharofermentans]
MSRKYVKWMVCLAIIICSMGVFYLKTEKAGENALASFKKIGDGPLYTMMYYGDYGFGDYLKVGKKISAYDDSLSKDVACSCFAALSKEGDMIFGRNFDWYDNPKLILFTRPIDGYASVSMVDMKYLNFNSEEEVANASKEELGRLLDAPYLPFDGMNEYGLAIGEMTAMGTEASIDPGKVTLGDLTVMRLTLDHAKTVEEAVSYIEKYNVYFPPAPPLHFLVADAKGNSAIIEFVKGEMKVLKNDKQWQVATNFIVYGSNEKTKNGCRRYAAAERVLSENKGKLTEMEAMKLLEEISQPTTQWSITYNMSKGSIQLVIKKNFDDIMSFNLPLKS